MKRAINNFISRSRSRSISKPTSTCVSTSCQRTASSFNAQKLTEENKEKIVRDVNAMTYDELRQIKGISAVGARLIYTHREETGPFKSLTDITSLAGVGPQCVASICSALKNDTKSEVQERPRIMLPSFQYAAKLTTPSFSQDFQKTLDVMTSLEFGHDALYYFTIGRDLHVDSWGHIPWEKVTYQNYTPSLIVEEAHRISQLLPFSDIFLMESRSLWKLSARYMQFLLFMSQLQAATQTLLNSEWPASGRHRVFHVKELLTINTFGLRVGRERVSGQLLVQEIEDEDFDLKIDIPDALWRNFHRQRDSNLERYQNTLLLAAAFCHHMNS